MNSREVRWITAAVAAGLLAAVAIGQTEQRKPAAPATGSNAPQTKERAADQATDPAAGRRQPRDVAESAPGKSVRMRGQTGRISDADRQAWRRALMAEAKYRQRLAKVRRYRELAEQAGDKKRIVKADYIEKKINQAHAKYMELAREQLGDEKFNLIKVRMQQGRERRGAVGKGKGGAAGKGKGKGTGQGRTGTAAPGTGQQDPQKRSRNRGAKDTDEQKSEDS